MLLRLAEGADVLLHNYRPQAARRLGMSYETFRAVNPRPRLRRHLRLPRRRALRRQAGLRRHHPGRLRPGLAAGLDRRRAALRADDRRRQDQLDDGAGRGARRPLPPGAHRRGPGGRGADVREHGRLGDGGAPLRRDVRAADRHHRLQADPQPEPRARSRRRTATWRSCRTRIRTGATSSPSPAGRICSTTRASRRSGRACATSRSCTTSCAKIALTRTNAEWLAELDRLNIPAMTVNTLEALLRDPHLEAVGFWQTVEHPTEGTLRLPGHSRHLRQDAGRHPPAAAAAGRAQRGDPARGRPRGGRDRHAPRLGGHARRELSYRVRPDGPASR